MRVALISCSKDKKNYPCPAHELYSASDLFSLSYEFAKKYADKIYILSAKHGLVSEDHILEPYDKTLNNMKRHERLAWADSVLQSLQKECNIDSDKFIFLAGDIYCRDLVPHIPNNFLPLAGLRYGERLSYLKKILNDSSDVCSVKMCDRLHKLFCSMPRYSWNQIAEIPFTNGIYIVFEKGERYHGMERIVRVGTHNFPNRLKPRLANHFIDENHDGSIFRKNIGKAILNECNDPYLENWTKDTSKPENRAFLDKEKNADTERRVSDFMRENFTFTVFQVDDRDERLRLEEAVIASLHAEPEFKPSPNWAGRFSPERKISESGMWLTQGLNGKPMTEAEFIRLSELCGQKQQITQAKDLKPTTASSRTPSTNIPRQSCGKYTPLLQFLRRQTAQQIIMTFNEMENILGFELPKSAKTYTMWWNPNGHPHCQAWLQAGFDVADVAECIRTKTVTFKCIK